MSVPPKPSPEFPRPFRLRKRRSCDRITPRIDTHGGKTDRSRYASNAARFANNITAVDLHSRMPGHTDIPRLRAGRVGGVFWYVLCSSPRTISSTTPMRTIRAGLFTLGARTLRRKTLISSSQRGACETRSSRSTPRGCSSTSIRTYVYSPRFPVYGILTPLCADIRAGAYLARHQIRYHARQDRQPSRRRRVCFLLPSRSQLKSHPITFTADIS